ncbi:MAG: SpoIIE family protein phosphatase [Selenomonadaceae bacterium]|nr:SpoIIE family protein phosphatase [Selenomonadaceae bacterium]
MSIRKKILAGGILFALLLTLLLSAGNYHQFKEIVMRRYEVDALRSAETALTFVDAENFSDYFHDEPKRQRVLRVWQRIVDTQGELFIYAIEPRENYSAIRFVLNVANWDSDYERISAGSVKATSSDEYKIAYRDLYEHGRKYAVVVRDDGISLTDDHITVMIPIKNLSGAVGGILCVQRQMDELSAEEKFFLKRTVTTMLLVLLLMLFIGRWYLKNQLLNPLSALTESVKEISGGNLDRKINVRTGDELQALAENFNDMTDELKTQMTSLEKVTAEKERIATELDVATKIQASMLPKNFVVDERADLCAGMEPAKEVGGDLYDFYKLDENHLFVTIADVSGKGVPAALFMVAAITNLRNFTANIDDLKTAIEKTNAQLCANNDGGLFVTAFSGVLDLETGIFRYVNAGHNPPLIRRRGKTFEELPMELNFVLGGWEDWQYVQQEIQLEAGDTIFMYTDGVTEATDAAGKMYSLERLKNFLSGLETTASAKEILEAVYDSLEKFYADADEQSDDITMLAVKFEGGNENG